MKRSAASLLLFPALLISLFAGLPVLAGPPGAASGPFLLYQDGPPAFSMAGSFSGFTCLPAVEIDENEAFEIDLSSRIGPDTLFKISLHDRSGRIAVSQSGRTVRIKATGALSGAIEPADLLISWTDPADGRFRAISLSVTAAKKKFDACVSFSFAANPGTEPTCEVFLAGDMNSWKPDARLTPSKDGIYTASLRGISKGRYKYKIVAGGKWLCDMGNPEREPDGFGSFNSVLTVGDMPFRHALFPVSMRSESGGARFVIGHLPTEGAAVVPGRRATLANLPRLSCYYRGIRIADEYISYDAAGRTFIADIPGNVMAAAPSSESFLRYYCYTTDGAGRLTGRSPEYSFHRASNASGPAAFRDAIMYFAMTDRFANGNQSNDRPLRSKGLDSKCDYMGGDYAGILAKAGENYFDRLMVDLLWISPVLAGPDRAYRDSLPPHRLFSGYHGYWPESLDRPEKRFGSFPELAAMVTKLRENHRIEVIIDAVFRHVTAKCSVFRNGPGLFTGLVLPDGTKNVRRFDQHPETTWFDEFLPAFDYGSAGAVRTMKAAADSWIAASGVRGFRLDAVKHIPHSFWRSLLSGRRNFFTVGETIDAREKIASYIGPDMMTAQFDFPLYFAIVDTFGRGSMDFPAFDREVSLSEEAFWHSHRLTSNLIGNHDFPRFMAYADGWLPAGKKIDDKELGFTDPPRVRDARNYSKLRSAFGFLMATNGVPLIYYGDEYGETGAGDPDNRRMMRFGDSLTAMERANLEFVRRLALIRKTHPALFEGTRLTLAAGKDFYAFAKCHFNETIIAVFNGGDEAAAVRFTIPGQLAGTKSGALAKKRKLTLVDLMSGERFFPGPDGMACVPVARRGFRYLELAY